MKKLGSRFFYRDVNDGCYLVAVSSYGRSKFGIGQKDLVSGPVWIVFAITNGDERRSHKKPNYEMVL